MKRYISSFTLAIAIAFALSAASALALDIPAAGETWTIPANTTNVVTEADMAAFNALGKVVFENEASALRFNTATAPNVPLEGAGWMIKDSSDTWDITQQQTTAWIGTWDFRDGEIKLSATEGGTHSHLFAYSSPYFHDVYVRSGAYLHFASGWKTCQAYNSSRFHLAGKLQTAAGGYGPNIRQMVLDGDAVWDNGTSTTPTFSYSNNEESWLDLNGHNLTINGDNYNESSLHIQGATIKGPGAVLLHRYVCGGMIIRSYSYSNYNGWLCLDGGAVVTGNVRVAATVYDKNPASDSNGNIKYGIVRHKDATFVTGTTVAWFGKHGGIPAYFLENGRLECPAGMIMRNADPTNVVKSASYMHFRQTGGDFKTTSLAITNYTDGVGLMADIAFGGSGTVKIGSGGMHLNGDAAFSFNDNVKFSVEGGIGNSLGGHHIWAYNGGAAETCFVESGDFTYPVGDFFALNGGACAYGYSSNGSSTNLFGNSPEIRIYEHGGELAMHSGKSLTVWGVNFQEPTGNVLKSVAVPGNTQFRSVPRVEIVDAGGTGSNAVAVADYDLATRTVTNITILSRGEGYSSSENVKANLWELNIYTNKPRLANLACTVGPEDPSCGFTYSATNRGAEVFLNHTTNFTHGTLVIDMDRLGLADHGAYTAAAWCNTLHLHYIHNGNAARAAQSIKNSHFPNVTNIVLKSGCIDSYNNEGGWGYNHTYNPCGILPNCWRLELYGGHLTGGSARFEDVVIGGEVWLYNHSLNTTRAGDIRICRTSPTNDDVEDYPGLLTVDVACLTNGVTPKIKYGYVHFFRGQVNPNTTIPILAGRTNSVVTVKNWECIPKSRTWTTILDLSDNVVVNAAHGSRTFCVPDIAYPDGAEDKLQIRWELDGSGNPYRLLARPVFNGTILIFK